MSSICKGYSMVIIAAILWGVSGTVAQYLFQWQGFVVDEIVMLRLLLAGVMLLMLTRVWKQESIWRVWSYSTDRWSLLIFGICGMLAVQYTYFSSIDEGNAATATLLQYLGPLFITIYLALRQWRFPTLKEGMAVSLALFGIFLLVTNASLQELTVPPPAIWWGLASALALAFYTLYPSSLLQKWSSAVVVGWGMVIGGIGLFMIKLPDFLTNGFAIQGEWSALHLILVLLVIIFGTLVPFFLYLDSLRYIKPTETSILASAEPLAAAVAVVVWLHVPFGWFQILGGVCIIATVIILAWAKESDVQMTKEPHMDQVNRQG